MTTERTATTPLKEKHYLKESIFHSNSARHQNICRTASQKANQSPQRGDTHPTTRVLRAAGRGNHLSKEPGKGKTICFLPTCTYTTAGFCRSHLLTCTLTPPGPEGARLNTTFPPSRPPVLTAAAVGSHAAARRRQRAPHLRAAPGRRHKAGEGGGRLQVWGAAISPRSPAPPSRWQPPTPPPNAAPAPHRALRRLCPVPSAPHPRPGLALPPGLREGGRGARPGERPALPHSLTQADPLRAAPAAFHAGRRGEEGGTGEAAEGGWRRRGGRAEGRAAGALPLLLPSLRSAPSVASEALRAAAASG